MLINEKKVKTSDGQQFHQNQQKELSPYIFIYIYQR